jgi:hypothetical protein
LEDDDLWKAFEDVIFSDLSICENGAYKALTLEKIIAIQAEMEIRAKAKAEAKAQARAQAQGRQVKSD